MRELNDRDQDAWNARDEEAFLAFYSEDHEVVAPGFTGKGLQGVRDFWALWQGAFPDCHIAYRILLVDGQQGASLGTFQGTHTGPLMAPDGTAIPPTGRQVTTTYSVFTTVVNDKVTRSEFTYDQMDLMGQLGLLPG